MRKTAFLFLILLAATVYGWSQPPGTVSARLQAQQEAEQDIYEEDYENRIRQPVLFGVYIPKDLGDAFNQLTQLTDKDSREKFAAMTEEEARHKLHFSLGRWIITNWGFYQGSRLSKYLNEVGIYEPDDMARFLILTYHRELNGKPLGVKELVEEFTEKRRLEYEQKLKEGEVIHEETRIRSDKKENE